MKFFVPFSDSPEQAERVYQVFVQNHGYPVAPGSGRLFSLAFRYGGRTLLVEVGQEINGFPEAAGEVLGIVETPELLTIHTRLRGGLSATPILVSPGEAGARVYFDDYPARPARA